MTDSRETPSCSCGFSFCANAGAKNRENRFPRVEREGAVSVISWLRSNPEIQNRCSSSFPQSISSRFVILRDKIWIQSRLVSLAWTDFVALKAWAFRRVDARMGRREVQRLVLVRRSKLYYGWALLRKPVGVLLSGRGEDAGWRLAGVSRIPTRSSIHQLCRDRASARVHCLAQFDKSLPSDCTPCQWTN